MAKKKADTAEAPTEVGPQDALSEFTNAEGQIVVYLTGIDGTTHYAWRKDGKRPELNTDDFARNVNAAIMPSGTANFASRVKPA